MGVNSLRGSVGFFFSGTELIIEMLKSLQFNVSVRGQLSLFKQRCIRQENLALKSIDTGSV